MSEASATKVATICDSKPVKLYSLAEILDPSEITFADKSIFNPKLADTVIATFDGLLDSAVEWLDHREAAVVASKRAGVILMSLRETIVLPNGFPDWAGKSDAWANLYTQRIEGRMVQVGDSKVNGNLGWSKANFNTWKSRVTTAMSDERIPLCYVAEYVCRQNRKLATTKDENGKTFGFIAKGLLRDCQTAGSSPAVDLPLGLIEAIDGQFNAQRQKSKNDGTPGERHKGFEVVPATSGTKSKETKDPTKRTKDSYSTKTAFIAKQNEKGDDISRIEALQGAHRILTSAYDLAIGKPGDKDPNIRAKGERETISMLVSQIRHLATEVDRYVNTDEVENKDLISQYRWQDPNAKK